jgi:hypothetical protein
MAKDKKSFVAYCDWIESFEELSDEEAGKLVKHLFRYVNDLQPECPDRLTKVCFIPIKQSLKRDLKKYDNYIQKQIENGKKGGRPKKPTDKTKTQKTQAFFQKPKKADNVNVNDNVSVNDNVINKEKSIKKEKLIYPFDTESFKNSIEIWKKYKQDQHRFKFKTLLSEQAFLKQISKDFNSELEVTEAIEYSMAQGYKGIFKPNKPQNNGSKNKEVHYNEELKRKLISNLSK